MEVSKKLSAQEKLAKETWDCIGHLQSRLQSLQQIPQDTPGTIAALEVLQEKNMKQEIEIEEKNTKIIKLEQIVQEKDGTLAAMAERFSVNIQNLSEMHRQREDAYRRALEQASELSHGDTRRLLEGKKLQIQKELQRERMKRQDLEKRLRTCNETFSVAEENHRWSMQANEALQKELDEARLSNQTLRERMHETTREMRPIQDQDGTTLSLLKETLAVEDMEYASLEARMHDFEKNTEPLIVLFMRWAQKLRHVGGFQAQLDKVEQAGQFSGGVRNRTEEIEQAASILALLRQHFDQQGLGGSVKHLRGELPSEVSAQRQKIGTTGRRTGEVISTNPPRVPRETSRETSKKARDAIGSPIPPTFTSPIAARTRRAEKSGCDGSGTKRGITGAIQTTAKKRRQSTANEHSENSTEFPPNRRYSNTSKYSDTHTQDIASSGPTSGQKADPEFSGLEVSFSSLFEMENP